MRDYGSVHRLRAASDLAYQDSIQEFPRFPTSFAAFLIFILATSAPCQASANAIRERNENGAPKTKRVNTSENLRASIELPPRGVK